MEKIRLTSEELKELIRIHNQENNQTKGKTWQRLRLAILERDNYICRECGSKAETVHHKDYGYISSSQLISVCSRCHMRLHGLNPDLISSNRQIVDALKERIAQKRGYMEAVDKGWFLPPGGISKEYWDKIKRFLYLSDLEELQRQLEEKLKEV